jgi:protein TonB
MQASKNSLSKWNAPLTSPEARIRAWKESLGAHALLLALALGVIWGTRGQKLENIVIDLVDAPRAPQAPVLQVTPQKPREALPPPAKAVFGQSRRAQVVDAPDALEFKAGNTVAKAPDTETLKAEDPDALPIPVEEYLVSRMPRLAQEVRIPYPEEARRRGVQGAVVFDLLIDSSGVVREVKLLDGPGFGLSEAALGAIRSFKFLPAEVDGKAVAVRIRYAYRFVLER